MLDKAGNSDAGVTALMNDIGLRAQKASRQLATSSTNIKNNALLGMALVIEREVDSILEANAKDLENAKETGLSGPLSTG